MLPCRERPKETGSPLTVIKESGETTRRRYDSRSQGFLVQTYGSKSGANDILDSKGYPARKLSVVP
jgi:hypothetical protein